MSSSSKETSQRDSRPCPSGGCLLGGAVGFAAGAVVGGASYSLSLLASVVIGAAGIALVDATNSIWPLIPVPITQLVSSTLIERATSPPAGDFGQP